MSLSHGLGCLILLAVISVIDPASLVLKRRPVTFYPSTNCTSENYLCKNGWCIQRTLYCDGVNNCGDNSDEVYCAKYRGCPMHYPFMVCKNLRCIPQIWKCDGIMDCPDGTDEKDCTLQDKVQGMKDIPNVISKVDDWINRQANNKSTTNKWGSKVLRTAVALYFANQEYFTENNTRMAGQSVAYEVSQRFLEAIIRENMGVDVITTSDLALFINALAASCTNVRDFNGMDLVARLVNETNSMLDQPSPFVLLSLCNTGYNLTTQQIQELHSFFGSRTTRTDELAFALMALSCAADRDTSRVSFANLTSLATKLKQRQHEDGSFENVPTTAIAIQALIASGEAHGEHFASAAKYLVEQQANDGSFGSLLNTYYTMPVLRYKSLLDLDVKHCNSEAGEEVKDIVDFQGKFSHYVHVAYSVGVGDTFSLVQTITIRVPVKSTFLDVMKTAAALDPKYRFKYILLHSKPYVYELCDIQDDAERQKYWHLIQGTTNFTTTNKISPADVIIEENSAFMMWYHSSNSFSKTDYTSVFSLEQRIPH